MGEGGIGTKLKALLLIPAAFAGAFTVLAFSIPHRTTGDVLIPLAVLSPVYLALGVFLIWMWRSPPGRRNLGLPWGAWSFLLAVAYIVGAASMYLF